MTSHLIWKLLSLLLLAILGTSYFIYRRIMYVSDKRSVIKLIDGLRRNNGNARKITESLDMPYGRRTDFSSEDFEKLKSVVRATTRIGDYTILYQTQVDALRYLLITEIHFFDYDMGVSGNPTDVKKQAYHFFILRFEPHVNTFTVLSDLYEGTTSKFQKEAFSRGLRGDEGNL